MAEVEISSMCMMSAAVSPADIWPVQWISADSAAPGITPLEAQLEYFAKVLNSAAIGTVLQRLPSVPNI